MADVGGIAGERLRSFVERIERLTEEKKAIAEDIKEVFAEATGNGFDAKTIRKILKLRTMSQAERDEEEALLDIYMAALGMLSDTPLGEAAIRHITRPPEEPKSDDAEPADESEPKAEPEQEEPKPPEETLEDARAKGKAAAEAGEPVTANPYPARDPKRAAWDEAWCMTAGTDGMDIPHFLKRIKPPKPKHDPKDNKKAA